MDELLASPVWAEVLTLKDQLSIADLSARARTRPDVLKRAFEQAGVSRTPLPRGRKPRVGVQPTQASFPVRESESPSQIPASPLDRARPILGRLSDGDVAEQVGVTPEEVKAWRRQLGVAPFLRPPPGLSASLQPSSGVAPRAPSGKLFPQAPPPAPPESSVVLRRRPGADGVRMEPRVRAEPRIAPPMPQEAAGPAVLAPAAATPAPLLDAWKDRLGKESDGVIAAEAGVKLHAIGDYRRRSGIPAYTGQRTRGRDAVPVTEVPTPVSDTGSTPSVDRLDAWKDRLGGESDGAIAAEAGVDRSVVGEYRRKLGIPSYTGHWTRGKSAQVARVETVAEVVSAAEPLLSPTTETEASPAPDAVAAAEAEPVTGPARASGHRRTKMDPFIHLIGVRPDAEVASLAGVTTQNVRIWRLRHGVPSADGEAKSAPPSTEVIEVTELNEIAQQVEAGPPADNSEPTRPTAATAQPVSTSAVVTEPGSLHTFAVTARSSDREQRFGVIGRDITDALARAVAGLARRADGPWIIRRVAWLAEALG